MSHNKGGNPIVKQEKIKGGTRTTYQTRPENKKIKGGHRDPHFLDNPLLYSNLELSGGDRAGYIVPARELKAKNPEQSDFRKWRNVPYGMRKGAHPRARQVRGLHWDDRPDFKRIWLGKKKKPALIITFEDVKDEKYGWYKAAIVDDETKIVVIDQSHGKKRLYCAFFMWRRRVIVLGNTPLVAHAHTEKMAISTLLGLPLLWHNGHMWSVHDCYRTVYYDMPYEHRQSTPPNHAKYEFSLDHIKGNDNQWAWEYWRNLPTALDPHYTSRKD